MGTLVAAADGALVARGVAAAVALAGLVTAGAVIGCVVAARAVGWAVAAGEATGETAVVVPGAGARTGVALIAK